MSDALTPADRAKRSIRVAAAIAERFQAILRSGPSTGYSNDSELALRIGEAQQVYPEIWAHLDEARKQLAERDPAALAEYDNLRPQERPGSIGVSDVDLKYVYNVYGEVINETKTAKFNLDGLRRAVTAVHTLERAMPEVDWAAVVRAERQELFEAGSLTGKRNRNLAIGAAIIVVLLILLKVL
jgi:hypothetical protein